MLQLISIVNYRLLLNFVLALFLIANPRLILNACSDHSNIEIQLDDTTKVVQIPLLQLNDEQKFGQLIANNVADIESQRPSQFLTYLIDQEKKALKVMLSKSSSNPTKMSGAVYYDGHIQGNKNSLVTIIIRDGKISGLVSGKFGNFEYTTYHNFYQIKKNCKEASANWECHNEPFLEPSDYFTIPNKKSLSNSSDSISIQFYCDYALYQILGSSHTNVETYINDLFYHVQILFRRDGIDISIKDIFIWDHPDPYNHNSTAEALLSFREITGINSDATLYHLLSGNSSLSGGIAFFNGLCDRNKSFAYSNVYGSLDHTAGYNWDVHVVAHEIGHNLGSQHTHACVWGPEGTDAIDRCGEPTGSCDDAPLPIEGGTIMSYCQNTGVGINFSLGFGPEPATRITETVQSCFNQENNSCWQSTPIIDQGVYQVQEITMGYGANHSDANHAKWFKFKANYDLSIQIASCLQGVDTRLFVYTGTCSELHEIMSSDDDCLSGEGYYYASESSPIIMSPQEEIFIEWDDRWSSENFHFNLNITPLISTCSNGLQDGLETGIDCGGLCLPCIETQCTESVIIPAILDSSFNCQSSNLVSYNGLVSAPHALTIMSEVGIELGENFEIAHGAQLETTISNCQN